MAPNHPSALVVDPSAAGPESLLKPGVRMHEQPRRHREVAGELLTGAARRERSVRIGEVPHAVDVKGVAVHLRMRGCGIEVGDDHVGVVGVDCYPITR